MNPPLHAWTIVTQVKSHRVVYYTDDPNYHPPHEADWYYCSPFEAELPAGMTLRNCWGWRFNGSAFLDAREAPKTGSHEALLEGNRRALHKILCDKVNEVRKPWLPTCRGGEILREKKEKAARDFLEGEQVPQGMDLLEAVAVSRGMTLREAAHLILDRVTQTRRVLAESERFREQISQAIQAATTQARLLELREWILDRVYPQISQQLTYQVENTRPLDPNMPVGEVHLAHERARLKATLRERVNAQRRDLDSGYTRNEEVWRHKGRIAKAVLDHGGELPPGLEVDVLQAYAQARGLSLKECAEQVVQSMAHAAQVLAQTEAVKDRYLARIDAIQSLREIRELDAELGERIHEQGSDMKVSGEA